jgi:hypothetical protein
MVFKKLGLDPEPDPDSPQKPKGLDPGPGSVNTDIDFPKLAVLWLHFVYVFNSANINFRYRRRQYGWTRMRVGAAHRANPRKGERKRRKVNDLARKHRISRVGNYNIRGTRYLLSTIPVLAEY